MIKMNDFTENDLKITWTLLYIAFNDYKCMLSPEEIVDYAISKLKNNDDVNIISLSSLRNDEYDSISLYLKKLSENENSNYDVENKKYRLIYIIKNMPSRDIDYIKGLTELGDLWVCFNFPDDSPHIFQGKNNSISPLEYYTKENYDKLYEKHLKWIEQEKEQIEKADL